LRFDYPRWSSITPGILISFGLAGPQFDSAMALIYALRDTRVCAGRLAIAQAGEQSFNPRDGVVA